MEYNKTIIKLELLSVKQYGFYFLFKTTKVMVN